MENEKKIAVCIKMSQGGRENMLQLVERFSNELGIKISKGQAIELAIKEALDKRK